MKLSEIQLLFEDTQINMKRDRFGNIGTLIKDVVVAGVLVGVGAALGTFHSETGTYVGCFVGASIGTYRNMRI